MDDGKFAGGVFLDFQKDFDTVNHKLLLSKLEHYGIRGIALNLSQNYLKNQFVEINKKSSAILPIDYGVPQGSVLGPLHAMIAFSFGFILSFWHYDCGYNVHNPVLQFFWKSVSIRFRASLNKILSTLNVTFPGYMEIFCNLALTCWHLSHLKHPSFVSNHR